MIDTTDSAIPTPPVDDSFEAWEQSQQPAPPAQEPKAEEKPKPSVPVKGETSAAPEAAPAQEQKPKQQLQQPKRKHDAESRIAELTRENAEYKRQLEDSRKNAVTPQESRPAPESRQPVSEPAKLGNLSDYVKAESRKRPDAYQEDLIQEWVQKREAEAEQLRQVRATGERINKAMSDFREKNPDVADAVFNELTLGTPQVNLMRPLMENIPNWTDVLHYLHENRDLYNKVIRSGPQEQWHAVSSIAWNLSNGLVSIAKSPAGQPAQEQPRNNVRPISRIPAPAKHTLGGGMPPEGKSMRDAHDFEEAEYLESRRLAGKR